MKDYKVLIGLLLLSLFMFGCSGNGVLVVQKHVDDSVFYLPLQSNMTDSVGDGFVYLYLDAVGSEDRIYYDVVGDYKP